MFTQFYAEQPANVRTYRSPYIHSQNKMSNHWRSQHHRLIMQSKVSALITLKQCPQNHYSRATPAWDHLDIKIVDMSNCHIAWQNHMLVKILSKVNNELKQWILYNKKENLSVLKSQTTHQIHWSNFHWSIFTVGYINQQGFLVTQFVSLWTTINKMSQRLSIRTHQIQKASCR